MARAVVEDLVCDLCGTDKRVDPYTVVTPEGARVIDLCAGDAKGLRKYWDAGSSEPRRKNPAKSHRPETHRVIPVD